MREGRRTDLEKQFGGDVEAAAVAGRGSFEGWKVEGWQELGASGGESACRIYTEV